MPWSWILNAVEREASLCVRFTDITGRFSLCLSGEIVLPRPASRLRGVYSTCCVNSQKYSIVYDLELTTARPRVIHNQHHGPVRSHES